MSSDGGRPALASDVGNRFLDIGAPQSPVTSARRGPQVIIIIIINNVTIITIIIRTLWSGPSLSPSSHSWSQSQVRSRRIRRREKLGMSFFNPFLSLYWRGRSERTGRSSKILLV